MSLAGADRLADRHAVEQVLSRLVREDGLEGVELIERDGQCLLECYRPDVDLATYSRLSATLAAAGESVLSELRASRAHEVVTEANRMRLVVVRANERVLLAALAELDRPSESVVAPVRRAAQDVDRLLHGPAAG